VGILRRAMWASVVDDAKTEPSIDSKIQQCDEELIQRSMDVENIQPAPSDKEKMSTSFDEFFLPPVGR